VDQGNDKKKVGKRGHLGEKRMMGLDKPVALAETAEKPTKGLKGAKKSKRKMG